MALVKCPKCGKLFVATAMVCPKCGSIIDPNHERAKKEKTKSVRDAFNPEPPLWRKRLRNYIIAQFICLTIGLIGTVFISIENSYLSFSEILAMWLLMFVIASSTYSLVQIIRKGLTMMGVTIKGFRVLLGFIAMPIMMFIVSLFFDSHNSAGSKKSFIFISLLLLGYPIACIVKEKWREEAKDNVIEEGDYDPLTDPIGDDDESPNS